MKLIDKDYAVDTAWSIEVYHGSAREVCEMLEDAPTVELIRCKECESHRNRSGICDVWHHHTSGEGFCHRGRRYGQQTESSTKGEPVKD